MVVKERLGKNSPMRWGGRLSSGQHQPGKTGFGLEIQGSCLGNEAIAKLYRKGSADKGKKGSTLKYTDPSDTAARGLGLDINDWARRRKGV